MVVFKTSEIDKETYVFISPELIVWWACRSSSVRPPFWNNFFSETAGPISIRFHMHPPDNGERKFFSNGPGPMNKMTAMLKYGKNLYSFFSNGPEHMT